MSCQKKKTPTELPKVKRTKVPSTRDRANIMKIIPTWLRASLSRFHLNGSSGSFISTICTKKHLYKIKGA